MKKTIIFAAILAFASLPTCTLADTISFITTVHVYGSSTHTFGSGATAIQARGYYFNGTSWVAANLFGRNDTSDSGVGICNSTETSSCGTGSGNGDYNEISNEKGPETVRIALPTGYHWIGVQLSSLDTNGGSVDTEHGILYGSSTGIPGPSGAIGTVICDFAAAGAQTCVTTGGGEPTLTISGSYQYSPYLFLQALDWSDSDNFNNDFLLRSALIAKDTPEPGSLFLLGSGLFGMASALRKRLIK